MWSVQGLHSTFLQLQVKVWLETCVSYEAFMKVMKVRQRGQVATGQVTDVNSLQCRFKQSRWPETQITE